MAIFPPNTLESESRNLLARFPKQVSKNASLRRLLHLLPALGPRLGANRHIRPHILSTLSEIL